MTKLVMLRLDGDLVQQGFQVSLEIGEDGCYPDSSMAGQLPANPTLGEQINRWQKVYGELSANTRIINPGNVSFGNVIDPKEACQDVAQQLAIAFQTWLKADQFRAVDAQLRQMLSPSDQIRLLIRTGDRYLHHLPWHLWEIMDQYSQAEVAFSAPQFQRTDTLSSHPSGIESISLSDLPPFKILAILGHQTHIDIEADRELLNGLPSATVTFLVEPQRQDITDQLWEQAWDILFFAGHSQTEAPSPLQSDPKRETVQGRIFLNESDSLTLDELKYGLKRAIAHGLQLALFNSCDGLGLAYELESLNIPQLIVMRQPVPDQVAQTFLRYFLQAFSSGIPVSLAARNARERLQSVERDFPCASWLPTLFQQPILAPFSWPPLPPPPPPPPPSPPPSPKPIKSIALTTLLTTVLTTGGVIALRLVGLLQSIELWAFDRLVQFQPHDAPDARLLIVEATASDLQQWGYPLSDQVLTQALQTLEASAPAVIGLDIFRAEAQDPGHAEFVEYLKTSDRLIAVCQHSSPTTQGFAPPSAIAPSRLGFNDVILDPDGVIRRHLIVMNTSIRSACTPTIALSVIVALEYLKTKEVDIGVTPDGYMQLNDVTLQPLEPGMGVYQQADVSGHQLLLNYRLQRSQASKTSELPLNALAQTVSLSQVLNGEVSANAIRDRIVLIGVTAPEPKDDFATPHQSKLRGLLLHAHMTSQLISAVLDDRPLLRFWPVWGDGVWIALWATIGSGSAMLMSGGGGFRVKRQYRLQILSVNGMLVLVLIGLCWLLLLEGLWVPLVPGGLSLWGSGVCLKSLKRMRPLKLLINTEVNPPQK